MSSRRVSVLGCPIYSLTYEQTVCQCIEWTRDSKVPHQIITVNAQTLVMMHDDPGMRRAIESSAIVVADGISVMLAAKLLGVHLPGRVVGVDLTKRLLEEGSRHQLRVFLLGAKPHVIRKMVEVVGRRYPGVQIAGWRDGYFSDEEQNDLIRLIRECKADILLVGMPTPFKETWCCEHLASLHVTVVVGVGGTFDVLSGYIARAPAWVQAAGLEWLWRLMMEPRKMWKRNVVYSGRFMMMLISELLHRIPRAMTKTPSL